MARAGHIGQYAGDDPSEFLTKLREQIESRVAHWLRVGPKGPVAAMHQGVTPTGPSAGVLGAVDPNADLDPAQLQNLGSMALDALQRKGKGKGKGGGQGHGKGKGTKSGGGKVSGKGTKARGKTGFKPANYGKCLCWICNQPGHWSKECPELKNGKGQLGGNIAQILAAAFGQHETAEDEEEPWETDEGYYDENWNWNWWEESETAHG